MRSSATKAGIAGGSSALYMLFWFCGGGGTTAGHAFCTGASFMTWMPDEDLSKMCRLW